MTHEAGPTGADLAAFMILSGGQLTPSTLALASELDPAGVQAVVLAAMDRNAAELLNTEAAGRVASEEESRRPRFPVAFPTCMIIEGSEAGREGTGG